MSQNGHRPPRAKLLNIRPLMAALLCAQNSSAFPKAKEGTRNDRLNKAAYALGQLVAVGALDVDETATMLIAEGQLLGLGATERERTVASGLNAGMEQPRELGIG